MKQVCLSYRIGRSAADKLVVEVVPTLDAFFCPDATFVLGTTRYYLHFLHKDLLLWNDEINFEATELARQQLITSKAFEPRPR